MTTAHDQLARLEKTKKYSEKDYIKNTPNEYKLLISNGYKATTGGYDEYQNSVIFIKRIYHCNDNGDQQRAYTIEASINVSPFIEGNVSLSFEVMLDSSGEKQTRIGFNSDSLIEAEQRIEKFFDALGRPFYGD